VHTVLTGTLGGLASGHSSKCCGQQVVSGALAASPPPSVGVVINVAIASHADPWLVSEGERLDYIAIDLALRL
jgi:hypothetical protein